MYEASYNRLRSTGIKTTTRNATYSYYFQSLMPNATIYANGYNYHPYGSISTIKDFYEKYGKGIWRYKPVQHIQARFENDSVKPLTGTRPYPCCASNDAVFSGETELLHRLPQEAQAATKYRGDPALLPDLELDPFGSNEQFWSTVLPEDWERLQHRFENRLPSLSESPDYSVSLKEFKEVTTLHHFATRKHLNLLARATGGLLSYQYGMKQIASDIVGLVDGYAHVAYKLEDIKKACGKVHDTHASYKRILSDTSIGSQACPLGYYSQDCGHGGWLVTNRTGYKIGVTAKYIYNPPFQFDNLITDTLEAFYQWKLIPDIVSLWDMIPYSFVVDWFVNTDKFFERYRNVTHPYDFKVHIKEMTNSFKYFDECDVFFTCPIFGSKKELIYKERTSYFAREVGPDSFYDRLPWFTWPSLYEVVLGLALGFNRMPAGLRQKSISSQIRAVHKKLGRLTK